MKLISILIYFLSFLRIINGYMTCPDQASMCGTIVLETGLGPNLYKHDHIGYHGFWISNNEYGNSLCIEPKNNSFDISSTNIGQLCDFINEPDNDYQFAKHEYYKHGICAGGSGPASVYFQTMCNLGNSLRQFLQNLKLVTFNDMQTAIMANIDWRTYLFSIDTLNKQFLFSVCSADLGYNWHFCPITN